MKQNQPSHQQPQQAVLGYGIKSAITAIQSAVKNLPREADVKARVCSSMIWSGRGAKQKDKYFQVREPVILGVIDPYFE